MEKDGKMEKEKKLQAICAKYELPRCSPADKRNGKGQKVSFTMYFCALAFLCMLIRVNTDVAPSQILVSVKKCKYANALDSNKITETDRNRVI